MCVCIYVCEITHRCCMFCLPNYLKFHHHKSSSCFSKLDKRALIIIKNYQIFVAINSINENWNHFRSQLFAMQLIHIIIQYSLFYVHHNIRMFNTFAIAIKAIECILSNVLALYSLHKFNTHGYLEILPCNAINQLGELSPTSPIQYTVSIIYAWTLSKGSMQYKAYCFVIK